MGNYDQFGVWVGPVGESQHDSLLAGDELPFLTKSVTVAKGQRLKRGSVLGLDKAGKARLSAKGATDGSQVPRYVLVTDLNAGGADLQAVVYKMGVFNKASLIFGADTKADDFELALEDRNIHFVENLRALPPTY